MGHDRAPHPRGIGGEIVSEFVLTGSDVFGRYCRIEQLRFGVPNEMHVYKVIASLRSNCWCEVPYKTASKEVHHDSIEDCVLAIHCGIDETKVLCFRAADVEFLPKPICDRAALLALAVNLDARATELLKANDLDQSRQRRSARLAHATDLMAACSRIREALGVEDYAGHNDEPA